MAVSVFMLFCTKKFMQPINELGIWRGCCLLTGVISFYLILPSDSAEGRETLIQHSLNCFGVMNTRENKAWLFLSRNHHPFIILVILKSDVLAECIHNSLTQNSIYNTL